MKPTRHKCLTILTGVKAIKRSLEHEAEEFFSAVILGLSPVSLIGAVPFN